MMQFIVACLLLLGAYADAVKFPAEGTYYQDDYQLNTIQTQPQPTGFLEKTGVVIGDWFRALDPASLSLLVGGGLILLKVFGLLSIPNLVPQGEFFLNQLRTIGSGRSSRAMWNEKMDKVETVVRNALDTYQKWEKEFDQ